MRFGWEFLFVMFMLIGSAVGTRAQDQPLPDVPWDSLMASIKMVDSSLKPDSVKGALLRQLFESYQITMEHYQQFYRKIMSDSPQQQTRFLKRVKEILEHRVKKEFQVYRQSKRKPVSGGKSAP